MEPQRRPPQKRTISSPITVAPKREADSCAFRKSCAAECFLVPTELKLHKRSRDELVGAINSQLQALNMFTHVGEQDSFETRSLMARRLVSLLKGAMVPVDYSGTTDTANCGEPYFPIQTYSIHEMRQLLEGNPLGLKLSSAYVSCSKHVPTSGLGGHYAELLAWIAAIKIGEGSDQLSVLARDGGVGGMRAMSRIAGEPAIDGKARFAFISSLVALASCASIEEEAEDPNKKELATHLAKFVPFESHGLDTCSSCVGLEFPLPEGKIPLNRLKQMAVVAVENLFHAAMNIANRIDSIITSPEDAVEENLGTLGEMHDSMKFGMRFLLDGKGIPPEFLNGYCNRKTLELYGLASSERMRPAMDAGEQEVARYVIAQLQRENRLHEESVKQILRVLAVRDEEQCAKERVQRMKKLIPA